MAYSKPNAMDWSIKWETSVKNDKSIKNKERCLISRQTRHDIISGITGLEELWMFKLQKSNSSIIPSKLNSDVIENLFCQQRTLHNPYLGYCNTLNAEVLGHTSISRKSNTWW